MSQADKSGMCSRQISLLAAWVRGPGQCWWCKLSETLEKVESLAHAQGPLSLSATCLGDKKTSRGRKNIILQNPSWDERKIKWRWNEIVLWINTTESSFYSPNNEKGLAKSSDM